MASEVLLEKEMKELESFDEDIKWFQDNYEKEIKPKHKGEYVAIRKKHIIDSDSDARKLLERLKKTYGKEINSIPVEFVSDDKTSFIL